MSNHSQNLRSIEQYCREHFCIGSIELAQLTRAADEIDRLHSTGLSCDAWDSRCAQLARQLEEAKTHPAIDEYPRLIAALHYIAEHDGTNQPRVRDPADIAKDVLAGISAPTVR